jgi:hypothetical protein
MIRKSVKRFSRATNAARLRGDHARTKTQSAMMIDPNLIALRQLRLEGYGGANPSISCARSMMDIAALRPFCSSVDQRNLVCFVSDSRHRADFIERRRTDAHHRVPQNDHVARSASLNVCGRIHLKK